MLRTDSLYGGLPVARARRAVERQLDADFRNEARPAVERNPSLDEVHRRRAYEPCHEQVGRMIVKLEWGAELLALAIMHDDDLVGHGHRLDLVVRHVNGRGAEEIGRASCRERVCR